MTFSSAAILLFLVMDPLGNVPLFVAALTTVPPERRRHVLVRELLVALGVLLAFLFGGNGALNLLGIRSESISVAGGIVSSSSRSGCSSPRRPTRGDRRRAVHRAAGDPADAGPSTFATLILLSGQPGAGPLWLSAALLLAWAASSAILLASLVPPDPRPARPARRRAADGAAARRHLGQMFLDGVIKTVR